MAGRGMGAALKELRTLFQVGVIGNLSDGELLERFLEQQNEVGEAAFEAIVRRHGPMVWRVCRGVLKDQAAVEDAFQATFLVLVQKAHSIQGRDSLGSWLFGVASRVASRAKEDEAKRATHELKAARPEALIADADAREEWSAVLQEVERLPKRYQVPMVLRYLNGHSYEQVAHDLGCPVGTVKARLSRARELLRKRLARQGFTLPAAWLASEVVSGSALGSAFIPRALIERTSRAAVALAMGKAATGGAISASATILAKGVVDSMVFTNVTTIAVATLAVGLVAGGAVVMVDFEGKGSGQNGGEAPRVAAAPARPRSQEEPANARRVLSAEEIQSQALEIARELDDPAERAETLLSLGKSQLRQGKRAAALALFENARSAAEQVPYRAQSLTPNHPLIRIASAQVHAGEEKAALSSLQKAVELLQHDDRDLEFRFHAWQEMLDLWFDLLGRAEIERILTPYQHFLEANPQWWQAVHARSEKIYPQLYDQFLGKSPDLWSQVATGVGLEARAGRFESALRLIHESDAFQGPDGANDRRHALIVVAHALRPEDEEFFDPILKEVKEAIQENPEPVVRILQLNAIAMIEARVGRIQDSLQTIQPIDPETVEKFYADLVKIRLAESLYTIAKKQIQADDLGMARATIESALRMAETIQLLGVRSHELSQALLLYCRLGDFANAKEIVDKLMPHTQDYLLESIASYQRQAGDGVNAEVTMRQALEVAEANLRVLQASPVPNSLSEARLTTNVNRVVWLLAKLGDVEKALESMEPLPDQIQLNALITLISGRAEEGDLVTVSELLDRIESPEFRNQAILRVAAAL